MIDTAVVARQLVNLECEAADLLHKIKTARKQLDPFYARQIGERSDWEKIKLAYIATSSSFNELWHYMEQNSK